MRILFEFSHPAQVHKFKHVLRHFMQYGHEVLVLGREKDVMVPLLEFEGLPHRVLSRARDTLAGMALELLWREFGTLRAFIRFRPTVAVSAHSVSITHMARLFRVPCIVHDDTEHASLQQRLYMPFATRIVTSRAYTKDWGPRQVRINSLEPLAYLHPDRFQPDPAMIEKYGLIPEDSYVVVRFIAWKAAHDLGIAGGQMHERTRLLELLAANGAGKIVMTSEKGAPASDVATIQVRPEDFHHVLAFAHLCVTEGGSTAYEAATLGVPTVYMNPLNSGLLAELERYGLIEHFDDIPAAMPRVGELLRDPATRERWKQNRHRLLQDKADMTAELVAQIEEVALGKTPSLSSLS